MAKPAATSRGLTQMLAVQSCSSLRWLLRIAYQVTAAERRNRDKGPEIG
jgi:hypothetical protein